MDAFHALQHALERYDTRKKKREEQLGLPPRPLTEKEVESFFEGIFIERKDIPKEIQTKVFNVVDTALTLLSEEIRRGSYPETKKKVAYLDAIIKGEKVTPFLSKNGALDMLIDMKGGAADIALLDALTNDALDREKLACDIGETFFISVEAREKCRALAESGNAFAKDVIERWAHKAWEENEAFPEVIQKIAVKVGDGITTGHLSPSKNANSRTDKPLHGTFIMDGRDDESDFRERVMRLQEQGDVAMVGGAQFGEGSSRKSATYNLLEVIGKKVYGEPEKKAGGVLIAKSIAPIFENSVIASGIIPLKANTDEIAEGDTLTVNLAKNVIVNETQGGKEIPFTPLTAFTIRKLKAGGMNAYMAKQQLFSWARDYAKENGLSFFDEPAPTYKEKTVPLSIAKKLFTLNRLDGKPYTETGESALVTIRGVFSQDTTGPMTFDEYLAMSGGDSFQSEFVIQSVCHTSECPTTEERNMQRYLQTFAREHGGIGLDVGEGIIHTIGNRFVLPTDIIVGGDSHTRSERGISFPAGSDIVAAAMKYGFLELTMDEEVKVTFTGKPQEGVTARDVVSTLVLQAEKDGHGKGVYNGRIIEFAGVEHFTRDERYILTNAVAERSASAGVMPTDDVTIRALEQDLVYLKRRYDGGDTSASIKKTLEAFSNYLASKRVYNSDEGAEYAAAITIDLSSYKEPLVACPHHPDNVKPLSDVAGTHLDEVFIGSCVGGDVGSIRAAAYLVEGKRVHKDVHFVVIPASHDIYTTLANEGTIAKLLAAGAVISTPSCGLCMGNKRRIGEGAVAFTTTTRNYQSRIGPSSSSTYLGSAHIAALSALKGEVVGVDEYMEAYHARITPNIDDIFKDV